MHDFSIGDLSKRCGVKVVTIRYYEQTGLMPEPVRSANGQRRYADQHIQRLGFIRHARELGFSPDDIRELLDLADHPDAPCHDAHDMAMRHIADINNRIEALTRLRTELQTMSNCAENQASTCKILESIGDFDHNRCKHHNQ